MHVRSAPLSITGCILLVPSGVLISAGTATSRCLADIPFLSDLGACARFAGIMYLTFDVHSIGKRVVVLDRDFAPLSRIPWENPACLLRHSVPPFVRVLCRFHHLLSL
jgi:hypothetical protein